MLKLTELSSCFKRVDNDSTQFGRAGFCGSILPHNLVTTAILEWRVSLCTWDPCSRMNVNTQFKPPDSKTLADSLVQMNSKT